MTNPKHYGQEIYDAIIDALDSEWRRPVEIHGRVGAWSRLTISGALRWLSSEGLIDRVPVPYGGRADLYRWLYRRLTALDAPRIVEQHTGGEQHYESNQAPEHHRVVRVESPSDH